jgi:hypothetical protein
MKEPENTTPFKLDDGDYIKYSVEKGLEKYNDPNKFMTNHINFIPLTFPFPLNSIPSMLRLRFRTIYIRAPSVLGFDSRD